MIGQNLTTVVLRIIVYSLLLLAVTTGTADSGEEGSTASTNLVFVEGGTFKMGDIFSEGNQNEIPVHQVTLSGFYIAPQEVTVGDFRKFIQETGYKTSAEAPEDTDARREIMERATSGELTAEEMKTLKEDMLLLGGAGYWDAEKCQWTGYDPNITWKNPGYNQTDASPVVAVSPDDAMNYCNWLSLGAGLPVAYDLKTGYLLDASGNPTVDIRQVRGFRLPTEAEWEYAAREGGRKVRFGNGKNVANSSEINFRANVGEYEYFQTGEYRMGTTEVGFFPPNSLGLHDMSGNAWEWAGDRFVKYSNDAQTNPYDSVGDMHALRGGRWGGDAFVARVFHRSSWVRNDRCNNSGFRIAKSK